ncbi:vesicle transport through interaction with t-SNAREs homolog 1B [Drosophila guanche]|uniref:Blast:Vesicle transport through interaction with t-SNAREs homolog 1B n=1 Tax=Drosophila guanche TaxID=7266 RepID=A0A3B0KVK1_DROGU|nr:vesicle transport through interaction with t-SNAREs homolog 1B [Drosophila guanche]SPP88008.1 blast:Vesicle transport through interaction with t-SNAREs homolog 1B [Drosophila guanche]
MSYAGYSQLPSGSDHEQRQQQLAASTYDVLQRTGDSIQRSNQIAIETENMGAEVLGELGEQRESLLRTTRRLEDADQDLSKSRAIIRKLGREVLYNKIILVCIILLELGILIGLLVLKFAHL